MGSNETIRMLLVEYKRPWKLSLLFVGLLLLIVGSFYYQAPDWDIPISFIMAFLAYLTAPWSLRVIVERKWKHVPLMLFFTWITVDGCYWLYWQFKNPKAMELMRGVKFFCVLGALCPVWFSLVLSRQSQRACIRRKGFQYK